MKWNNYTYLVLSNCGALCYLISVLGFHVLLYKKVRDELISPFSIRFIVYVRTNADPTNAECLCKGVWFHIQCNYPFYICSSLSHKQSIPPFIQRIWCLFCFCTCEMSRYIHPAAQHIAQQIIDYGAVVRRHNLHYMQCCHFLFVDLDSS